MSKKKTFKDFYTSYSFKHDTRDARFVDKKKYVKILREFFKLLSKEIIEEAYEYKIPHGLGFLYIHKYKSKKKPVDWKRTREYFKTHGVKKYIYFMNTHSGGWSARWYWDKRAAILKNKSLYKFVAIRKNKRAVGKTIRENNTIKKYLEKQRVKDGKYL